MKKSLIITAVLSALLLPPSPLLRAFPPAPHHTFMGQVRDELGNPLSGEAKILFETASGRTVTTFLNPGIAPGVNYRLSVPMDAGLSGDAYKPTAMRPTLPFTIRVEIGRVSYLPIEVSGNANSMGEAGQTTFLNLTLGVDSDNDGLPDAWEQGIIDSLDGLNSLADVRPGDDADGDGLSNLAEYISGNYAFDSEDGFDLKVSVENEKPMVEWLGIRGRTYTVYGSANLNSWSPVAIRLPSDEADVSRADYRADDVRKVKAEALLSGDTSQFRFFRVLVQ